MKYVFILITLTLSGCGAFSATTLRCGTDSDSSYVEIASAPQSIANNTRAYAELCGFAYDNANDLAKLNIIDQTE
jgi:hypothetical protein